MKRIVTALERGRLGAALVAVAVTPFVSCGSDPVLSDQIASLGNETAGVPKGEFHRPGQPCVVCHQEGGPASDFPYTVAGTVFAQPNRQVGVERAEIRMTDSGGTKHIAYTNCVGNFKVTADEWDPKFPIIVEIAKGNVKRAMQGTIGRDPSCGNCHSIDFQPPDPFSQVKHIYLFSGDEPGAPNGASDCGGDGSIDPERPGSH